MNKIKKIPSTYSLAILIVVGLSLLLLFVGNMFSSSSHLSGVTNAPMPVSYGEVRIGEEVITVEVLRTKAEREEGLSGRTSLPEGSGAFFIFERADKYGFWMPDMHFPIDIIWIGDDLRIADIASAVSPRSYPKVFYPASPARYVLEVPAGIAEKFGWKIGDLVTFHPNPR